jgi:hypothetical protein
MRKTGRSTPALGQVELKEVEECLGMVDFRFDKRSMNFRELHCSIREALGRMHWKGLS